MAGVAVSVAGGWVLEVAAGLCAPATCNKAGPDITKATAIMAPTRIDRSLSNVGQSYLRQPSGASIVGEGSRLHRALLMTATPAYLSMQAEAAKSWSHP